MALVELNNVESWVDDTIPLQKISSYNGKTFDILYFCTYNDILTLTCIGF